MSYFEHIPHPWIRQRKQEGPIRIDAERVGFGARVGERITAIVGTMVTALGFTILALISLPAAIRSGDVIVIVAWIAQTFLQLVLLPIIIVGQNIQAAAADARSQATYEDAAAVLEEAKSIQKHLEAQDAVLMKLVAAVASPEAT
jgi:hypothetical protein